MTVGHDDGIAHRLGRVAGSAPAVAMVVALLHLGYLAVRPTLRPIDLVALGSVTALVVALSAGFRPGAGTIGDRIRAMAGVTAVVALVMAGAWLAVERLSVLEAAIALLATSSLAGYVLYRYSLFVHGLVEGVDER